MRRLTWGRGVKLTLGCRERCGHQRARSSCVHERVCVKFRPTLWFIHSVPLAFIISYKRSVWCIITNLLLCIFVISCRILQTLERMLTADWQEDQKRKKNLRMFLVPKRKHQNQEESSEFILCSLPTDWSEYEGWCICLRILTLVPFEGKAIRQQSTCLIKPLYFSMNQQLYNNRDENFWACLTVEKCLQSRWM